MTRMGKRIAREKNGPGSQTLSGHVSFIFFALLCILGGFSLTVPPAFSAELGSATEAVKTTIDAVFKILADDSLTQPEHKAERLARLQEVIGQRFDYVEMGKRTLSRHWKKLNQQQQETFSRVFQKFLLNTYAGNVDAYAGEQVQYVKERRRGDFAEVRTKAVSGKLQIPLDYRLLKKSGQWYVYDIVIDGVSLVRNFRGQFDRIMKSSSFEGLLTKLRHKVSSY